MIIPNQFLILHFQNYMAEDSLHIGNCIKEELKRQDRSIAWLSRQVFCDRSNLSRVLQNQYIDICLLRRISISLRCNFFQKISYNIQQDINNQNSINRCF